jgi:hypothetical protein
MPGPAPKAEPVRRNSRVGPLRLPAEGRKGEPPAWPLSPDRGAEAELRVLNEEIDDLSLVAQGDGAEARAAERKLFNRRIRVETLTARMEEQAELESSLWAQLWATPQAVAWDRLGYTRVVARYVRLLIAAERLDKNALAESRQLEDRLGLTPKAMRMLLWEIVSDEVAEKRTAKKTTAARRRMKAVE